MTYCQQQFQSAIPKGRYSESPVPNLNLWTCESLLSPLALAEPILPSSCLPYSMCSLTSTGQQLSLPQLNTALYWNMFINRCLFQYIYLYNLPSSCCVFNFVISLFYVILKVRMSSLLIKGYLTTWSEQQNSGILAIRNSRPVPSRATAGERIRGTSQMAMMMKMDQLHRALLILSARVSVALTASPNPWHMIHTQWPMCCRRKAENCLRSEFGTKFRGSTTILEKLCKCSMTSLPSGVGKSTTLN